MDWYQWMAFISLLVCLTILLAHLIRLIYLGKPNDRSQRKGSTPNAIRYAYTGAMSPMKKESAFLHLPTYAAGMIFHFGTFLSIFFFFVFLLGILPTGIMADAFSLIFFVSGMCGLGIFVKRVIKKELRALSNPDDYISNLLVTAFQFLTAAMFLFSETLPTYFVLASVLLLYIPLGKLKHAIYFFAARYQLGFFYGWRGSWPPKQPRS